MGGGGGSSNSGAADTYAKGLDAGTSAAQSENPNFENKNIPDCTNAGFTVAYCQGFLKGYYDTENSLRGGGTPSTSPPNEQSSQGNGIDYTSICRTLQPVLLQSCDTLINPDGSLTIPDGTHAMHCIRNGILLGGGASLLGLPLPIVLKGLSILAPPTGCDGIVDMSGFNQIGNIGSLSSIMHFLP
jgi:hypothetical protein